MKKEITYISFDGKRFNTAQECRTYEERQSNFKEIYEAINTLDNYCRKTECDECPFYEFNENENYCKLIKRYSNIGWFKLPSTF